MFVHRKDIIKSYEKVTENFKLFTVTGEYQGTTDDYIATNLDGDQFVVSEEYVKAMENIEIKPQPRKKKDSPFMSEYIKQLSEMGELQQEESNDYLEGNQNGWAYKDNK